LLHLGKSLIVILNYVQQPEPCGPEPCSPNSGPGPVLWLGKVREHHVSREKLAVSPNGWKLRTSRRGPDPQGIPDPPMGSRTPCIVTGPLSKEKNRHPASGWSGATTCQQAQTRI